MFEILSDDEIHEIYRQLIKGAYISGEEEDKYTKAIATAQRDKDIRDVVEDLREKLDKIPVREPYRIARIHIEKIIKEYSAKLGGVDNGDITRPH